MNSVLKGVLSRGGADLLQLAMGIAGSVFSVTIFLMPVLAFAQGHAIVMPGQLVWKPLIPGVEMAVVSGDPDKKGGLYVIRIRSKGEVKVPPHWHPTDEHITVLAGSFLMARGEKYDASKLIDLKPGAHSLMTATMAHFGLHKAGNEREAQMGKSFMTRGSLDDEASPIACDLSALSPDQRARLKEVRSQLRPMVREVRDLPDGYAFLLSAPAGSLVRVAEFIEPERRCCPFFKFELEVQEEGGAAWLRLRGSMGVKQFIAAELGLEKAGNEGLSTERTSAR